MSEILDKDKIVVSNMNNLLDELMDLSLGQLEMLSHCVYTSIYEKETAGEVDENKERSG